MRRVIVLGGLGHFGRTAATELRRLGVPVQIASRSAAADIRLDANDAASIRAAAKAGDIVLDAAGPFHARSPALVEAAVEIGFDVVDLNDSLGYAEAVLALEPRISAAGIRVLSSASTVSALAAAVVSHSGTTAPRRVTAFLAPASRRTANAASALSLVGSVGVPVRVFRDGRLLECQGWSESRAFPMPEPLGTLRARLFESADNLYLPRIWPSLRDVSIFVDTNTPGVNLLLRLAARSPLVRRLLERQVRLATWLARRFGPAAGGIGYEIEDGAGRVARYALLAEENSFVAAVAPAVLAARAIAGNRFPARGLILPHRHVEAGELFAFLTRRGLPLRPVS